MDLFVINRYNENQEDEVDLETKHILRLKQKIEERKKASLLTKSSNEIILKTPVQKVKEPECTIENETEEVSIDTAVNIVNDQNKKKPSTDFKVIGVKDFQKKVNVRRILPFWLSHPATIPTSLQNLTCNVEDQLWLHPELKSMLINDQITQFFPVQEYVIPFILKQHEMPYPLLPRDICVSAPTGSGKTLAFVLPILQVLSKEVDHNIRALIVLPVQELAVQVAKVFKKFAGKLKLKVALLTGSVPLRQEQQQIMKFSDSQGWISNVDIIVCTAGRLVEHIQNTTGFTLRHLKFVVIDEADRIMEHIQNDWLYHLDKHIKLETELMTGKAPSVSWHSLQEQRVPPHKLLFSATLSQDPEKLDQWGLFQPCLFSTEPKTEFEDDNQIGVYTTPDELTENCVVCEAEEKPLVLYHLLIEKKWRKVLCFTNSAQSAHRLATLLGYWGDGQIKVAELSASLDRAKRDSVLKKFQASEIDVLIGTDALARGIDIPNCDYVISYDVPKNIKTYIHRVGRTGRAGRIGCAVTTLRTNQVTLFNNLLKSGGKSNIPEIKIDDTVYENLCESYEAAIGATKDCISEEVAANVKKSIALKRGLKTSRQDPKSRKVINRMSKK